MNRPFLTNKYLVVFIVSIVANSCRENTEFKYISVATGRVEYDGRATAKFYGTIENRSVQPITESGFILSVRSQDNNGLKFIAGNSAEKSLTAQTTYPLVPGKLFYVRAYAISQGSTIYGSELSFKTSGGGNIGQWKEVIMQENPSGYCDYVSSVFSLGSTSYFTTAGGLYSYNHQSSEFKLVLSNSITNLTSLSFVYNGEAFLFSKDRFYKFNPLDKSLTGLSPWPLTTGNRQGPSWFVINDDAYIGLGYDDRTYVKDFWKFNIKTNTWARAVDFAGDVRSGAFSMSLGGLGYTGGGGNFIGSSSAKFNDLWQYNAGTQQWKAKQSVPVSSADLAGTLGTDNAGLGYVYSQKKLFEYNPFYDYWESLSNLTTSRSLCYPTLFSYNGKVYLAVLADNSGGSSVTINLWAYEK